MPVAYLGLPVHAISEFQDTLANSGFASKQSWALEIRLYKANAISFKEDAKTHSLFTVDDNYKLESDNLYAYATKSTTVFSKDMRSLIDSKLKSLWQLRQNFKGDGSVYDKDGMEIRFANISIQGSYKGLLIDCDSGCLNILKEFMEHFKVQNTEIRECADNDAVARRECYSLVYK